MCLLIAYSRVVPGVPLLVAANRDEMLSRPAKAMARLHEAPRILGGRDLQAGGTWLAVSEKGVVAALTNRPPKSMDLRPNLRSRGELPLRLAKHATAAEGAAALARELDPELYNPCWILVGDAQSLFYMEISSSGPIVPLELPAGIHILENRPLGAPSPKVDFVRGLLPASSRLGTGLLPALRGVLSNREVPPAALADARPFPPPQVEAACVDAGVYGTRWSGLVGVGPRGRPRFAYCDGAPDRGRWKWGRFGG